MPTYAGYTAYQLAACIDSALAVELADKGALRRGMPDDEESDSDLSDEEVRTWVAAFVFVPFVCSLSEICRMWEDSWTVAADMFILRQ